MSTHQLPLSNIFIPVDVILYHLLQSNTRGMVKRNGPCISFECASASRYFEVLSCIFKTHLPSIFVCGERAASHDKNFYQFSVKPTWLSNHLVSFHPSPHGLHRSSCVLNTACSSCQDKSLFFTHALVCIHFWAPKA